MVELTAYQRNRLAVDERVFWCGKTRPTAWFGAWPLFVALGILICAISSPVVWHFSHVVLDSRAPLAIRIFFAILSLTFEGVGLSFMLSPLGSWIRSHGGVWAITDRRVVRFFGPFVRSWRSGDLFEHVEWAEAGHGRLDFAFAERRGRYKKTYCIENVRWADVPAVKEAFRQLEAHRHIHVSSQDWQRR